ncbi:MAG: hypothetical protein FWF44_11925, partial [Defluviitaleaceae bacterium]|nr:hypothetical protein [Defluviitaleaceae bacterium]
ADGTAASAEITESAASQTTETAPPENTAGTAVSILWVGNSLTYEGDMPGKVAWLASTAGVSVKNDTLLRMGASLSDLKSFAIQDMNENHYDYAVFQDYGGREFTDPDAVKIDIDDLCNAAMENGTTPIILSPALSTLNGYPDLYNQELSTNTYENEAQKNKAIIVKTGNAWVYAYMQNPALVLYQPDGIHPTDMGAYLNASVFVSTVFNKQPDDADSQYTDVDDAVKLNQYAWEFVNDYGGDLDKAILANQDEYSKLLSLFSSAAALPTATPNQSSAESGDSYGTVPDVSGIVVDGVKDSAYDQGVKIDINYTYTLNGSGPNANGASWLVWNDGYLYVYTEVYKDNLSPIDPLQEQGSPWIAESAEVFVDPGYTQADTGTAVTQYRIDSSGYPSMGWGPENIRVASGKGDVDPDFVYAAKIIAGGYAVEFKIPIPNAAAGMKIGLMLQINDMQDSDTTNAVIVSPSKWNAGSWDNNKYNYIVLG